MSSAEGAFVGSPEGARVAKAPPSFGLVPITSQPQSLWASHLLSFGGPGLDLYVRADWTAAASAPQIFTAAVTPNFGGISDWQASANGCGVAGAGHYTTFTNSQPGQSATLTLASLEIGASSGGPFYTVTTDYASGAANPWGLFLSLAQVSISSFSTTFGAYLESLGALSEYPGLCAAHADNDTDPVTTSWRRTANLIASPCTYTADARFVGYLEAWLKALTVRFRRTNGAASTSGQEYRARATGSITRTATEVSRPSALYHADYDAIGMSLTARPPILTRYACEAPMRVYLGAGPTS